MSVNEVKFKELRLLSGEIFEAQCGGGNGWRKGEFSVHGINLEFFEKVDGEIKPTRSVHIPKTAISYIEHEILHIEDDRT